MHYYDDIKKYAQTLGLTTGILWLTGGIVGVYYAKGSTSLLLSALMIGGLPILITLIGSRFNILGSILFFIIAASVICIIYLEGISYLLLVLIFLSYSLPLILAGAAYIKYWYKSKTRI